MLRMERGLNYGVMEVIIMGNIEMDKNMGKEYIIGQMGLSMQGSGNQMRCMEQANLYGLMEGSIREHLSWE